MIDDDDFDVLADRAGSEELASLLADVSATRPVPPESRGAPRSLPELPSLSDSLGHARPSDAPTGVVATPPRGNEPPGSASTEHLYGLPGSAPWEQMAYAYRVLDIGTRTRERAVLLARDLADSSRSLDECHAALGRAIHDAAEAARIVLDPATLTPVRAAVSALDAITKARAEASRKVQKLSALAAARRESASASLDPANADQEARLGALDSAERERERCQAAFDAVQREFRDATIAGAEPDVRRGIDARVDEARTSLQQSERAHRDAALAYAESRRRALLQIGRVHEAERAVEGLRVEERREQTEAERREDIVLRALREAYAALGASAFDLGKGRAAAAHETAAVERARADRTLRALDIEALRMEADTVDPEAFRRGRTGWIAAAGMVLVLLVVVAVIAA